jgi:protein-S-isoprenylcysteine O-methyltransferase Ste14
MTMRRWLFFLYGAVNHAVFFGVFAYMAGFVGNFLVPKTIDSGMSGPVGTAVVINVLLLLLFAVQHSVMARPAFKRVWKRVVPEPIERSTYVMLSNVVLILLMWQWRPIDRVIWDPQSPVVRGALWGLFAVGWLLVPLASLLISHFDLFGTRQVWLNLKGRGYESLPFRTPSLYKHVRHPLYVGWMIAFWATPTMTVGHALFASFLTAYMILAAALLEEPDLVAYFGRQYEEYRQRVPMFIPWRKSAIADSPQATHQSDVVLAQVEVNTCEPKHVHSVKV